MDIVVIGAGVVGAACAWRLAQAGARVTMLERNAPASGASRAALGVLQFHAKVGLPLPYQQLGMRSRELFPPLLDELAALTGERVPYRADGHLTVALAEGDWEHLEALYATQLALGLPASRLAPEEVRRLEPDLSPRQLGGVFLESDAWVDNTRLTLSLARAAEICGTTLVHDNVQAIQVEAGRATGVLAAGRTYAADWVVLAAGCWSGQIAGVPPLPVEPVRGQALLVQGTPVRRVVSAPRSFLVPKGDSGQTLVGSTVERVGFDESNTVGGLAALTAGSMELCPAVSTCRYLGAWAGLRPGTPDGLPCLGPFAGMPNLIAAAGHMRNGILQAPSTAEIVLGLITGRPLAFAIDAFRPDRPIEGVSRS